MKYIVGESSVDVDVAEPYMQLNKEETGKHRIEVKIQKMSGDEKFPNRTNVKNWSKYKITMILKFSSSFVFGFQVGGLDLESRF